MRLALKPTQLPFAIGDTVWVDQPFGATHEFPFFQGTIMQIILDGSLANTLVIRQRTDLHELVVGSAIYGLKPVGGHAGSPRVNVNVQLIPYKRICLPLEKNSWPIKMGLLERSSASSGIPPAWLIVVTNTQKHVC